MPKNKGKGGKNRRRGKNENEGLKRELVFKEDGQEYAQVSFAEQRGVGTLDCKLLLLKIVFTRYLILYLVPKY